ncbi:hypothetical protein LX99_04532 [Mucilaginibacter oryzae]|uniref:Uncharacterized protein n=1 Tax=Mucilaginibacter oryzae TaxID=468058 RepID=A0A316GYU6_9SPHI|nr:hypothetical protein [Mucilaginibacter oryzae]PWK70825.1 hypothetical protein LX99_04532 [Mucilaginibacter oryzae]
MSKLTTHKDKTVTWRLLRQVKHLIRTGRLKVTDIEEDQLRVAAVVRSYQLGSAGTDGRLPNAPDGFRLLLSQGQEVKAALDFHYKGARLFFTHMVIGHQLDEFVTALNLLEETYRSEKKVFEVAHVDIPLAHQIHLIASSASKQRLYRLADGAIHKISDRHLQKETDRLQKRSQPITAISHTMS